MPNVLLWSVKDNEYLPLIPLMLDRKIDSWYVQGDVNFANTLAEVLSDFSGESINAETSNGSIMIYTREQEKPSQIGNRIVKVVDALVELRKRNDNQLDQ